MKTLLFNKIFYLEKKKHGYGMSVSLRILFWSLVSQQDSSSCDSTFIFLFILYLICDIWTQLLILIC